ncbi:membrane protein insertase YidC [bacterium]|nr:membrane protein insertase YidC [bacterium]
MDKIKEEVRLVIAFVLAMVIIMVFGRMQSKGRQNIPQQPKNIEHSTPVTPETTESPTLPDLTKTQTEPSLPQSEEVSFDFNDYTLTVSSDGNYLTNIGINKYQRKNEQLFYVFENSQFLNDSILKYEGINNDSLFTKTSDSLILTKSLNDIFITKEISVPSDSHIFKTGILLENRGPKKVFTYMLQAGIIPTKPTAVKGEREFSPPEILVKTGDKIEKINPARLKENVFYENTEWLALKQRYPLLMLKMEKETKSFIIKEGDYIKFGFLFEDLEIDSLNNKRVDFTFYAGPSDYFVASKEIEDKLLFGGGFFVVMGRILFTLLSYIHKVIPNWGWAIVFLTLLIKIVFFPLTKSSLKSMKALQKLRPYMTEVQKKYKDNPQQMQKEMMNLYKDYKINPLGGCIPMLLQFPIFIGFFLALRSSIFFRGASFGLWIKDLSVPDSLFQVSGFTVNVLPLIMAATSLWQQKLTPQDPSQKTLTFMMPIMFLFLFYNFSSGLLLYWITMNVASLVEQYFIHKK